MPYIKRERELLLTLRSFDYWYKDRDDFEIVIVEDYKNLSDDNNHKGLVSLINVYRDTFRITHAESPRMVNFNPSPLYNLGVIAATGEYIVLTSPECFHTINILKGLDDDLRWMRIDMLYARVRMCMILN